MKMATRKATMTNKQRVEALLRREKPDRVPNWPFSMVSFAVLYYGGVIADRYTKSPKWVYEAMKKTSHDFDLVFMPTFVARRGNNAFGGEVKLPTSQYSQATYVLKYPVETPEQAMAVKMPDVKRAAGITDEVMDFYKLVCQDEDDNKPFNLSFGAAGGIGSVANIIGPEKLCKWMLKEPEVMHHLLRLTTDQAIATAQYYKDVFGVERIVATGGSAHGSNQLISPKHFEQFVLPYLKEAHEKVLAMGFKRFYTHICGDHNLNLPYWQQMPMGDPGIITVPQEIDLATMAKYFPNDIIAGNLNTSIIQVGTPDEVYEETRKVVEKGKSLANGYIFSPGCGTPPRAPVENMMAITRAVNDFGWYD